MYRGEGGGSAVLGNILKKKHFFTASLKVFVSAFAFASVICKSKVERQDFSEVGALINLTFLSKDDKTSDI